MSKLSTVLGLVLLATLCLADDVLDVLKEKPKYDRLVVIGDFHGDSQQAVRMLFLADVVTMQPRFYEKKLINGVRNELSSGPPEKSTKKNPVKGIDMDKVNGNMIFNKRGYIMEGSDPDSYHWAGKKTLLVIPGDALDVGPNGLEIIRFLMRLEREAAEVGGKLVFLLGNHEMLNLEGNFNGVHPWAFEKSGGRVGRLKLLSMDSEVGRWLRSRDVLFLYDGLIFMHGGVTPRVLTAFEKEYHVKPSAFKTVDWVVDVNKRVHDVLQGKKLRNKDRVAELVLNVDYKTNAFKNPLLVHPLHECDAVIKAIDEMPGVHGVIVGHTPHNLPQYDYCHGHMLAVDFKNSEWKAGKNTKYGVVVLKRKSGPPPTIKEWREKGILAGWKPELKTATPAEMTNQQSFWTQFYSIPFWASVIVLVLFFEIIFCLWRRRKPAAPAASQAEKAPIQPKPGYGTGK